MSVNVAEVFGQDVFNEAVMKERLPEVTYKQMVKLMEEGGDVTLELADIVAKAMKEWAIEKGATHYTHIFQPYIVSIGAEKHDSFADIPKGGKIENSFSGKDLLMGEPDASSFPSGGLRATCAARGYTAWDVGSPAYVKDGILCIPTAFCAYTGESLDTKTPLLKACDAVSKAGVRFVRMFGNTEAKKVRAYVGPEQEYFIVNREKYLERPDLIYAGRTLFGAPAPKGQEMEDQYFGPLKTKIADFMADVDEQLWKLGITVKTQHNEVAPGQHEIAPIFAPSDAALDSNFLVMDVLKSTATKHGLACLLHEKPFAGVNGSGKHNNWSMITNTGVNLLEPGRTPAENAQFLIFLMAVIKAVDDYADLLRISVASAGNDHRLGANEAPPAIISIFLGDELTAVLDSIENDTFFGKHPLVQMDTGATVLPHFFKDNTDRNRTSPFAFTGNKFEFRSLGSSSSVAGPNIILNTAVAEALRQFYGELKAFPEDQMDEAVRALVKRAILKHKKVIFNGNGYSDEWVQEAEKRGLYNLKSTPDALPYFIHEKNIDLFTSHHIFSKEEIFSRYEILLETYSKTIHIEAKTMEDMVRRDFLPALMTYTDEVAASISAKKAVLATLPCTAQEKLLTTLSGYYEAIYTAEEKLEADLATAEGMSDQPALSLFYHETILPDMDAVRSAVDAAETYIPDSILPYPNYEKLLFSV